MDDDESRGRWLGSFGRAFAALGIAVALGLLVFFLAAARGNAGVNRRDYVHRNRTLLQSLPVFPGAIRWQLRSLPTYDANRDNEPPPIGYLTRVFYRVPNGTTAGTVVRFYRTRLKPLGWRASIERIPGVILDNGKQTSTTFIAEFKRDGADVDVNTRPLAVRTDLPPWKHSIHWTVELTVDHQASN